LKFETFTIKKLSSNNINLLNNGFPISENDEGNEIISSKNIPLLGRYGCKI
jgi:hypothetical protein